MNGIQTIAGQQQDQILTDSVKPGRHMTLTLNTTQGWKTYKGKFEGGSHMTRTMTAMILLSGSIDHQVLTQKGIQVGCTFRLGHKKCMFSTVVVSTESRSGGLCVTLQWPQEIQQLQRRAYDRTSPPNGSVVAVRFWRDDLPHNATQSRDIRHGQMEDISAGGMRIKIAESTSIDINEIYRCTFAPRPDKPTFVVDALLRHKEAASQGRTSLGFQFVGLEATTEGRRQLDRLARLANRFKRAHSRPHKPRPAKS